VSETYASEEDSLTTGMLQDSFVIFEAGVVANDYEARARAIHNQMLMIRTGLEKNVYPNIGLVAYFQPIRALRAFFYQRRANRAHKLSAQAAVDYHRREAQLNVVHALLETDGTIDEE
jgi:hypothetical protein